MGRDILIGQLFLSRLRRILAGKAYNAHLAPIRAPLKLCRGGSVPCALLVSASVYC